jgi:hypothetical protein
VGARAVSLVGAGMCGRLGGCRGRRGSSPGCCRRMCQPWLRHLCRAPCLPRPARPLCCQRHPLTAARPARLCRIHRLALGSGRGHQEVFALLEAYKHYSKYATQVRGQASRPSRQSTSGAVLPAARPRRGAAVGTSCRAAAHSCAGRPPCHAPYPPHQPPHQPPH